MTTYLKVRQIRNYFFKPTFFPKNERTNLTLLLVDLFAFVFWKKVKTPKRHFEINWPLMPCPYKGPKIFWAGQNFCAEPKFDFQIVPVLNFLCQTKRWFLFSKFSFCASTKKFWRGTKCYILNFWSGPKHVGTCERTRHKYFYFYEFLELG